MRTVGWFFGGLFWKIVRWCLLVRTPTCFHCLLHSSEIEWKLEKGKRLFSTHLMLHYFFYNIMWFFFLFWLRLTWRMRIVFFFRYKLLSAISVRVFIYYFPVKIHAVNGVIFLSFRPVRIGSVFRNIFSDFWIKPYGSH